ncbi:uncharacterized protein [Zea mays]|jgi:hypothetical protein|uniref:Uncharacterized protein n=1 Tax=Zea mays TaxID=4577 RepID=A0A804N7V2_MAIZE|nr:uncharacterized protein LOC103650782 [Zea mays]|eukprot:XP_008674571.3 uncharacterized protein LOC103650782 [Zea mays]
MGRRSFPYHKLKKLLPAVAPSPPRPPATMAGSATAAAIKDSYRSYYFAVARRRSRRLRRARVWGALARALWQRAAAAGALVRASAARVACWLRNGRPYVGDLFVGNYMFLQVAPSPMTITGGGTVVPFAQYNYGCKARAVHLHRYPTGAVLYET